MLSMRDLSFSDQELNPRAWHWKHTVLTTRLLGNFQEEPSFMGFGSFSQATGRIKFFPLVVETLEHTQCPKLTGLTGSPAC